MYMHNRSYGYNIFTTVWISNNQGKSCNSLWSDHLWPYAKLNGERHAIWDSTKLPIGVEEGGRGGAVQMDREPIWAEWGHNRNQSIKAERADSRNLALSSSTYQGYQINLTLLSEWPPGRKWVEGHDLESTSQTSPSTAHRESHGKLHSHCLCVPDGIKIRVEGWRKSLKTHVLSQPPPQEQQTDT